MRHDDASARSDSQRIEALLAELTVASSPEIRAQVEEVVRRLVGLYGAAFHRLIEHVEAEGVGPGLRARLLDDELVASLLMLHGLHPAGGENELVQLDLERSRRTGADTGSESSCELCAVPIGESHRHVIDTVDRDVRCACIPCSLLFMDAAAKRHRTIPDRVLVDPDLALTPADWSALGVPVRLVFIACSSATGEWIATFPSPAGPTEAELDPDAWAALSARSRLFDEVEPDVEAVLVHGTRGAQQLDCMLVPVDVCYRLVASVRQHWRGIDGGDDTRREIEAAMDDLRRRSRPLAGIEGAA